MRIRKKIRPFVDLHIGKQHEEKTIADIRRQTEFYGSHITLLTCAVLLTSIGLQTNSIIVLIGAMLVSPLMGPILGIGLSLGISDTHFFRTSLYNFFIASIITLCISTLFFCISPVQSDVSELTARTYTTFYDVLIACIGGFAGIIALTRSEKDTVIAGVAIATALILPLCTVGFGIATMQTVFIIGAFKLYSINCICIASATYIGIKYLKS